MTENSLEQTSAGDTQYLHGGALFAAIAILAIANFMAILDITIINVAVPHIAGSLAISPNEGTWVVTSYAVAEAITVPLAGWLAARFGAVRVFVVASLSFGFFSLACGFAPSLSTLVIFRVLQGFAGGPMMPMSQTMTMRVTPPQHVQMTLGFQTATSVVAPIAGPIIGGMLTDSAGWPWAFYINFPISILCAFMVWRLLRSWETDKTKQPIDYVGLVLLMIWIGALQIMLDKGQNEDWFASPFILTLAIIAGIGFVAFLIWELTDAHPIVDLQVFRNRTFSVLITTLAFTFATFFATIVLIPLWLQINMGYTATLAGYVMSFQGILGVCVAPIAAVLVSRMDPRIMMSTGLFMLAGATLWRVTFTQDITFWQLVPPQLITGMSLSLFAVPMLGVTMASVPPAQTASAAGLLNFIRTTSSALGTAVATTAWDQQTIKARVNLGGALHEPQAALNTLQTHGLSSAQSLQALENLVQSQAVMVATNQIFMVLTAIIMVVAASVWLAPKPERPVALSAGGH